MDDISTFPNCWAFIKLTKEYGFFGDQMLMQRRLIQWWNFLKKKFFWKSNKKQIENLPLKQHLRVRIAYMHKQTNINTAARHPPAIPSK